MPTQFRGVPAVYFHKTNASFGGGGGLRVPYWLTVTDQQPNRKEARIFA